MTLDINVRWQQYRDHLQQKAALFMDQNPEAVKETKQYLERINGLPAPTDTSDLHRRMKDGDAHIARWDAGGIAYKESPNHEPIPMPETTIAEQADQACNDS